MAGLSRAERSKSTRAGDEQTARRRTSPANSPHRWRGREISRSVSRSRWAAPRAPGLPAESRTLRGLWSECPASGPSHPARRPAPPTRSRPGPPGRCPPRRETLETPRPPACPSGSGAAARQRATARDARRVLLVGQDLLGLGSAPAPPVTGLLSARLRAAVARWISASSPAASSAPGAWREATRSRARRRPPSACWGSPASARGIRRWECPRR